MNKKLFFSLGTIILIILLGVVGYMVYQRMSVTEINDTTSIIPTTNDTQTSLSYRNNTYGFLIPLPESWRGYSVSEQAKDSYLEIRIMHPQSTSQNPRMDIPVLVVPIATWNKWYPANGEGNHPFAAPIAATERARNTRYVFATAPRYNYAFASGYEEVEEIVQKITALNIFPAQTIQPAQQTQQGAPVETFPLFEEGEVKG